MIIIYTTNKFYDNTKIIKFKPKISNINGSKIFKSIKESKYLKSINDKFILIIIDECSMISKNMVTELNKYESLYPIKIVYLGDDAQLPPVGEKQSLIFDQIPINYKYHIILDEIMRTKSIDIKDVCQIIRKWKHARFSHKTIFTNS